jgi:hypothetical protein
LPGKLSRLPEANDPGHILGPGSPIPLVVAAVQHLPDSRAFSNVEGADSLGTMDFVRGHREKVDFRLVDRDSDFADRLNRVYVKMQMVRSA